MERDTLRHRSILVALAPTKFPGEGEVEDTAERKAMENMQQDR